MCGWWWWDGKLLPWVNRYSFGLNKGLVMYMGGGFRGPNSPSLDNGILKVGENFETSEQRNALGIIAIRVVDLFNFME